MNTAPKLVGSDCQCARSLHLVASPSSTVETIQPIAGNKSTKAYFVRFVRFFEEAVIPVENPSFRF